jgi:hypothetical protein
VAGYHRTGGWISPKSAIRGMLRAFDSAGMEAEEMERDYLRRA